MLCTIEDEAELRGILGDLRATVHENGRVIVTVCDPHFTFGGPSPEADRELPPGACCERNSAWRKTIRATGGRASTCTCLNGRYGGNSPAPLCGEVALMIKVCSMEAGTLGTQVRHLVSQLEGPRAFAERILMIDSREDAFPRQHTRGSLRDLRRLGFRAGQRHAQTQAKDTLLCNNRHDSVGLALPCITD